ELESELRWTATTVTAQGQTELRAVAATGERIDASGFRCPMVDAAPTGEIDAHQARAISDDTVVPPSGRAEGEHQRVFFPCAAPGAGVPARSRRTSSRSRAARTIEPRVWPLRLAALASRSSSAGVARNVQTTAAPPLPAPPRPRLPRVGQVKSSAGGFP